MLVVPSDAKVSDTFLIGVRADIVDARITHIGNKENLFSTEVCANVGTASWKDSSDDERHSAREIPLQATLSLAGGEISPKEALTLRGDGPPVYWSFRPSAAGQLKGWIAIDEKNGDADVGVEDPGKAIFSIMITPASATPGYLLTVLGSIAGALLASVPAWLAWYDKWKSKIAEGAASKIVRP